MTSHELHLSEKQPIAQDSETHYQFVERLNNIFSAERAVTWSRVERLLFNLLMSRLIFNYGYGLISNAMLCDCRAEMAQVVRKLSGPLC